MGVRLDSLIEHVAPSWALRRAQSRQAIEVFNDIALSHGSRLSGRRRATPEADFHNPNRTNVSNISDREYARQLDAEDILAHTMLDTWTARLVGSRLRPKPTSSDEGWNTEVADRFDAWAEKCDIRGMMNWEELIRCYTRAWARDGEGILILRKSGHLEHLDIQSITQPRITHNQKLIHDGVEYNRDGRPIRFHISHDGSEQRAVRARDAVWLPEINRAEQTRGVSFFSQSFTLFEQIQGVTEAVVVAARVAACFSAIITQPSAGKALSELTSEDNYDGDPSKVMRIEPGMVRYAPIGSSVTQVSPQQPSTNFNKFIQQLVRFCGLPFALPLELALFDFSDTNLSAARAALLQSDLATTIRRTQLTTRLRRIYQWWVSREVKHFGLAEAPGEKELFKHEWKFKAWPRIDPNKEIPADAIGVDTGQFPLSDVLAKYDWTIEDYAAAVAKETQALKGIAIQRSAQTREPGTGLPAAVSAA